ncbi:AMP-binding protein [Lactobacillus sp. ESL0791]|uniref:AMP-binding protein n=1 Tax=Lactobacillus sp. ESL0791 TaxID=2983234 RepID=UPI0023F7D27D|nr:AMP-binding protein [Lactobacillus sp. ESL0791]MDF7639905.1 AMP-binding protein [Lactobacillus sp. ESL0791]
MNGENYVKTVAALWDKRIEASAGNTFLINEARSYSYGEIAQLVDEQMKFLLSLGIKAGSLVALQFELDVENIVMIIACIKLKVIINPLNPHFDVEEIKNLVKRFNPFAIIAQKSIRGRDTLCNLNEIPHYQTCESGDLKIFVKDNQSLSAINDNSSDEDAALVILNTSGTSGAPKGVVLTNKNVLEAEYGYNKAFAIKSSDMILMPSGMYHAIGFHHGLISTIIAGSTIVIMKHYQVDKLAQLIAKYPITYIDSLPTIMYDILFKVKNLGKLKQLICGGDKIKPKLLLKAKERQIPLYNCYGLTEAVPFSYTPAEYFVSQGQMTTAVKPIEKVKTRLVASGKLITESNAQGIIEVAGPVIFKEYFLDLEKTKQSFDGEWFVTGDVGHYNQQGLLEIDGRNSDKIIRGGENISAQVVEDKIKKCKNIKEVAVLGVPDERLGQRIGAFIVLLDANITLTKEDLLVELANHNVDKKFWPEKLWVLASLPRTANGKIKKYILKEMAER